MSACGWLLVLSWVGFAGCWWWQAGIRAEQARRHKFELQRKWQNGYDRGWQVGCGMRRTP